MLIGIVESIQAFDDNKFVVDCKTKFAADKLNVGHEIVALPLVSAICNVKFD